jgi:hypothetical protein
MVAKEYSNICFAERVRSPEGVQRIPGHCFPDSISFHPGCGASGDSKRHEFRVIIFVERSSENRHEKHHHHPG